MMGIANLLMDSTITVGAMLETVIHLLESEQIKIADPHILALFRKKEAELKINFNAAQQAILQADWIVQSKEQAKEEGVDPIFEELKEDEEKD
jgi:hypothetical protein